MAEKNSLWKNKPTTEMIRQERKIKAKKYAEAGPVGEDGKEPIAFEVTGPTYEVVANNPNGKPKPNWDLPEGFGGYQKMEPSSTSTNVPNIVRVQRDTIDRPEIYKEQQKRLLKEIKDEKQRIIKQVNDPNTIGAVKIKDVDSYAQEMAERKIGHYNTPLDQQVGNYATDAAWAMIPEVAPFLNIAKGANKYVNLVDDVNYSKYLTQEEAVAARGERLISQKNKPGWDEQLTSDLEQRLSTAVERHNPASDLEGTSLGINTAGRTATEVSKNAISKQGIPLNEANKARIAAHEVGHYYSNSPAEGKEWASHFDFSKLSQRSRDYLMGKGWKGRNTDYANEVRERAAQLKDYIAQKNGIPLNQDFIITESMLDDAITNYVKNTGLDNSMSEMLGKLVNKKGLLKTMNKFALGTTPLILTGAGALQNKKEGGYLPTQGPGEALFKGYAEGGYSNPYQQYAQGGYVNQYATGSFVTEEGEDGKPIVGTNSKVTDEGVAYPLGSQEFNGGIPYVQIGPGAEVFADKPDYLKAYDEEYERRMNEQKAFQEAWYRGQDYDKTPLENRAAMAANDAAAKIIIERKKSQGDTADKYNNRQEFLKIFNDKEKSIIGNSNLAGYIGPDAGSSFRAALNNIHHFGKGFKNTDPDLTQEEANNISRWNIFSPLGVPGNIVKAALMGDDIGGTLHGRASRPWTTSDERPMGMEDVTAANILGDIAFDPLNLAGMGIGKNISNALKLPRKIAAPSYFAKPVENIANFTLKAKDARDNIVRGAIGSKQLFDQVIGELARGRINKRAIEEGNKYLENWIQNKATQDKIDADIPADIFDNQTMIDPSTNKQYLFNIPELIKKQAKNFKPDSKEYSLLQQFKHNIDQYLGVTKQKSIHGDNWGVSYKHNYDPIERQLVDLGLMGVSNRYGSWVSRINKLSPFKRAGTTLHENVHDWVDYLTIDKSGMRDMVLNNLNTDYLKDFHEWEALHAQGIDPASIMGDYRAFRGYMANPTEIHARTMELRRFFNITPDQFITDDFAKQMVDYLKHLDTKKNTRHPITGLGYYLNALDNDPQKVSTVFNKLWGVVPAAVVGTAIPSIGKTNNNQSKATGGYTIKNNNNSWRNYLQYRKGGPYDESAYDVNSILDKGDKARYAILNGPLNEGIAPLQAGKDFIEEWTSSPGWPERLANTALSHDNRMDASSKAEKRAHNNRSGVLQQRKEDALERFTKGAKEIPKQLSKANIMYSSKPEDNERMMQQMLATFTPEALKKYNKDLAEDPKRQGTTIYPGNMGGVIHVTNYAGQPGQANPAEVVTHELGPHFLEMPIGTDATGATQYQYLDDMYADEFDMPTQDTWQVKDGVPQKPDTEEFLPFLWQMRQRHNLKEDGTVMPEELQQMRKSGDNNPLYKYYPKDEDLLYYLNEFGEVAPRPQQQQFQQQAQPQVPYQQHAARGGYYAKGGPGNKYVPSGPGGEMPLGLPLKEQNPYLVPEYNQPMANGYILPDPNRPRVLPDVNATEYKSGIEIDGKEHQVPTIVGGQYIGDHAWNRYNMSGEEFKPMANPSSYSKFYDTIEPLGLMKDNRQFAEGGYTNPYNQYQDDPYNQYKVGGKVFQIAGNAAYGALAGTVNTVTGGLTTGIMNKGQQALQKAANPNYDSYNKEDRNAISQIDTAGGIGEVGGSILGGAVSGNVGSAVASGASGANKIVQSADTSDSAKQWSQGISAIAQLGHSMNGVPSKGSTSGGANTSKFGDVMKNFSGSNFGKSATKAMPYVNQAVGMLGGNKSSLGQQGQQVEDYLNSPEYLKLQKQGNITINNGVSFSQGGNITNNSLNLRNTMRYKRFAQGGTFDQYGINMIPDSAGLHHESAYGGVPIGPNALAEGGEIKMDTGDGGQYIVSDQVDGAETQKDFMFSKGGKYKELNRTLADGMKQDLNKYTFGSLATSDRVKGDLRRPNDSYGQSTVEQIKQKWQQKTEYARQRSQQEQAIAQAEEQKRMAEEQYIAAYGGRINPKKYPGLNMTKKAKGGYVHNQMTQPMYAEGGPGKKFNTIPIGGVNYTLGESSKKNEPTYPHPVISNNKVIRIINDMDERWMVDPDDQFDPTWNSYFQNRYVDLNKELNSTDLERVKKAYETAKKERIGGMAGYAQGGPIYGDPASEYVYARGGQIDYTNDMYAGGGPMVSNVNQPFNGPSAQNRGGMYLYPDGGMMPPEQQMMQEQMMQQQQAPQEQMQQQGGGQEQMMQIVEQVIQALMQGTPPEQIMQQLVQSGVPQDMAMQAVQMAMQEAQGQMQQQEQGQQMQQGQQPMQQEQQMMPPQGMMARGGRMRYDGGGTFGPITEAQAIANGYQPAFQDEIDYTQIPTEATALPANNGEYNFTQNKDYGIPGSNSYSTDESASWEDETEYPTVAKGVNPNGLGMNFKNDKQVTAPANMMMQVPQEEPIVYAPDNMMAKVSYGDATTQNTDNPWSEEPWYSKASRYSQAIPGIAATVTGMLNKKRKLTPSLMTAQTVNYEPARITDRRESNLKYNKYADTVRNMGNQGYGNLKDTLLNSNADEAGRRAKSVMDERNTNAQFAQQANMTNTGIKNQYNQLNEQMFQNAQTQALVGLGDTTGKLANTAQQERKQYLQEWIARNRLKTRNYSTEDSGEDVYSNNTDGYLYDSNGNRVTR